MNKKEVVQKVIQEFFPLYDDGVPDRLSDKIVAALDMNDHFLFKFFTMLVDIGFTVSLECEGMPIDDDTEEPTENVQKLFEASQAVDMAEAVCYLDGEWAGWIMLTNCNAEDESICDYTCGEKSEKMDAAIDKFMEENCR